jgi:hypothetical protein
MDRFNLGSHSRTVSTSSPETQRWFDLGLNWCFAFNKEEGVKCFQRALEFDPGCVMAHWGIAYGAGPFYNLVWREHGENEAAAAAKLATAHIAEARALAHRATDLENQLVEALARRFPKAHAVQPAEYDRWDDDYAAEMRRVYYNYPDDHDAGHIVPGFRASQPHAGPYLRAVRRLRAGTFSGDGDQIILNKTPPFRGTSSAARFRMR